MCRYVMCVHVSECVYVVPMHVCICGWKPEDNISCLPRLLSAFFFFQDSLQLSLSSSTQLEWLHNEL